MQGFLGKAQKKNHQALLSHCAVNVKKADLNLITQTTCSIARISISSCIYYLLSLVENTWAVYEYEIHMRNPLQEPLHIHSISVSQPTTHISLPFKATLLVATQEATSFYFQNSPLQIPQSVEGKVVGDKIKV